MADRMRVAAAGVNGLAAALAQHRRLDRAEALEEIRRLLGRVPAHIHQDVLDHAAAGYVVSDDTTPWYPAALALLAEAGADVERARLIRAGQGRANLGGLGEAAARNRD